MELEFRIEHSILDRRYRMAITSDNGREYSVAQPLVMKVNSDGEIIEPTIRKIEKESLQGLFNELWNLGFRPLDGTGNSGHIAAMQYHLEDMRKLVFKGK